MLWAVPLWALAAAIAAAPLDLSELIREALANNPDIKAAQKSYEASKQRPSQASALPDPTLSFNYNSVGRPWPGAGLGREPVSNIGVMASQEFPYPGKRKLRGDIASKESEAEFQQYQAAQLTTVTKVKQAYYRLAHSSVMRGILTRNRDLLTQLLRVTEARYASGKAAQQDVLKAQAQISIIETRLVRLDQDKGSAEAELSSLAGRPVEGEAIEPDTMPLLITIDELMAAARENSPMLTRDRKMIQKTELAVNLARKDLLPDYTLSGGYYNMGGMAPMFMFRADVQLPLWAARKQRPAIAEAGLSLNQARRTYEATGQNLAFRIKDDYLMATTAEKLMRLYGETVVPQATLALESSLTSYETGTIDFLSVLMNLSMVLEYEMNYHEALMDMHVALTRLEEMTGLELIH